MGDDLEAHARIVIGTIAERVIVIDLIGQDIQYFHNN